MSKTNNLHLAFLDELTHLSTINSKLADALQQAHATIERINDDYMDAKRYMAEYRAEIDPHELFQNELSLKQIDRTGAFAADILQKLSKLQTSPYFARIDFREKHEQTAVKYYIGRFSFSHEQELLILDWRTPIAGMFYDCEPGAAIYHAPIGKVEGYIERKRQIKIQQGELEYVLESSLNIRDELLQRELAHTADEKMKSIIATIQKEQNQVIRSEHSLTIIIQGVAGSGKTSIALHRIAFLLYRFKEQLSAQNITILSPNKVFGDYISGVLPELGEEPIKQLCFADLASVHLDGVIKLETVKDPLVMVAPAWAERVRFKSTLEFTKQLDAYLQYLPNRVFSASDYTFGSFVADSGWIQTRFAAYQKIPIKKRLKILAEDIRNRFAAENFMGDELPKLSTIHRALTGMLTLKNTLAVYKDFYEWLKIPKMFVLAARQTLEWADVFPFLYMHEAFVGLPVNTTTKHLVIDEMQDYTPIQYKVINSLYPCPKTILGDFGQFINAYHLHTLNDMQELYPTAQLVKLNKSYRSTYEIINFAKNILTIAELEPIARHGDQPLIISCQDAKQQITHIKNLLEDFIKSERHTLGIVTKTNVDAQILYQSLSAYYPIKLITPDSSDFAAGISVTSIQMSKGLEFDEVVIPDTDGCHYHSEYDRNLLYIAVTRAMHRLTLLHIGDSSPFIN